MSTPYLRFTGGALRIRAPAKATMTHTVDTSILKTNTPVAVVEVPVVVEVAAAPEPVAEVELNRDYTPLEVKPALEVPDARPESGLIPQDPATE